MAKLAFISDSISHDLQEAVKIAAREGLRHVELQTVWQKPLSELTDEEVARIKRITSDAGISVCCLSQKNLFGAMPVGTTEIGDDEYSRQLAALDRLIQIGEELGTSLLRIMCFRKEMVLFGEDGAENAVVTKGAWDKFVQLMAPPVKIAESRGVTLAVENSTKGMVTSAYLGRKLIDEIGSKSLRFLWDPCNAFYFNETSYPDGYDCLRGGYLAHLHIKDGIADIPKAHVRFVPLGQGQFGAHLDAVAAALKADGYDGYASMESLYRPASGGGAEAGFLASVGAAKAFCA